MATSGKTFRWDIIGVLLAIVFAAWLFDSARVAFEWRDVMHWFGVRDTARFTRLCVLGLSLICIVAVIQVLRGNAKDDGA
jgi:hypothetical protein